MAFIQNCGKWQIYEVGINWIFDDIKKIILGAEMVR